MRLRRVFAPLAVLAAIAACTSVTFTFGGPLAIRAGSGQVQLDNRTSATVYTFVIERDAAARTDWIPCTNPATCDGLAPGEQRSIAYPDIPGYQPGADEAIVYWWHLIPAPGGSTQTDSVRAEVIQLR